MRPVVQADTDDLGGVGDDRGEVSLGGRDRDGPGAGRDSTGITAPEQRPMSAASSGTRLSPSSRAAVVPAPVRIVAKRIDGTVVRTRAAIVYG